MHEKVNEFLKAKKKEERKRNKKIREANLLKLELYEKEYNNSDMYSYEYPFSERDEVSNKTRYFKKVPIQVSDEEYEAIMQYADERETKNNNSIATALWVMAWFIYIGGFIVGSIVGGMGENTYYYGEFSFAAAVSYWCVALIGGTIMLGFSEIIKLLNEINNK